MTAPVKKPLAAVPQFQPTTLATQDVFPRDACLDWMREKCDPKHKKYQVIAFSLSHIDARAVGDAFTDITHVMLPVDDKTGALPQGLTMILETAADEFNRAASAHCAALFTNRQGFLIKGHHRGGTIKLDDGTEEEEDVLTVPPRTTFPFSVTPPVGARENYEGNEKPTAEGALASFQRQLDTASRNNEATIAKVLKGYEAWNEKLVDKLTEMIEINVGHVEKMQDLADRKQLREISAQESAFKLETQAKIIDNIEKYVVPTVALVMKAKLGLVDAVPAAELSSGEANPAALIATVRALKLTPAQLGQFVATLDKTQQDMLQPLVLELSAGMSSAEQHELVKVITDETAKKHAAKLGPSEPQGDAK